VGLQPRVLQCQQLQQFLLRRHLGTARSPRFKCSLTNVQITSGKYGMVLDHVRNVHFDKTTIFTPNPSSNQTFIASKSSTTALPIDSVYWTDQDINSPAHTGNGLYAVSNNTYTVSGGGSDIGPTTIDQFNFDSTPLTGDATLVADVSARPAPTRAPRPG